MFIRLARVDVDRVEEGPQVRKMALAITHDSAGGFAHAEAIEVARAGVLKASGDRNEVTANVEVSLVLVQLLFLLRVEREVGGKDVVDGGVYRLHEAGV